MDAPWYNKGNKEIFMHHGLKVEQIKGRQKAIEFTIQKAHIDASKTHHFMYQSLHIHVVLINHYAPPVLRHGFLLFEKL